jgi:hypothetical protein
MITRINTTFLHLSREYHGPISAPLVRRAFIYATKDKIPMITPAQKGKNPGPGSCQVPIPTGNR